MSDVAKAYVTETQDILRKHGIDPFQDRRNLVWAPNWSHTDEYARDVLERSIPVWEEAMKNEITAAEQKGADFGREEGIDFVAFSAGDQMKLDELYNAQALKEAQRLTTVDGGDAAPVLRRAQEVVAALKAGEAAPCGGSQS